MDDYEVSPEYLFAFFHIFYLSWDGEQFKKEKEFVL